MNYAARQYDAMIESWLYTIIWTDTLSQTVKYHSLADMRMLGKAAGVATYGSRKDIGMRIQRKLRN